MESCHLNFISTRLRGRFLIHGVRRWKHKSRAFIHLLVDFAFWGLSFRVASSDSLDPRLFEGCQPRDPVWLQAARGCCDLSLSAISPPPSSSDPPPMLDERLNSLLFFPPLTAQPECSDRGKREETEPAVWTPLGVAAVCVAAVCVAAVCSAATRSCLRSFQQDADPSIRAQHTYGIIVPPSPPSLNSFYLKTAFPAWWQYLETP